MNKTLVRLWLLGVMLSGCGGGGSGGSGGGASGGNALVAVPFNNSITPPSYANNFAAGFYATLNMVRSSVGVGTLNQSVQLDNAAQRHADYLAANFNPSSMNNVIDHNTQLLFVHSEDVGIPGFFGGTPILRSDLSGYLSNPVDEVTSPSILNDYYDGQQAVDLLLATAYHRPLVLNEIYRNMGIGNNSASNANEAYGWGVVEFGGVLNGLTFPAPLPIGTLSVFPAPQSVDLFPWWETGLESPVSFSGVIAATMPVASPISAQVPFGDTLTVQSFTLDEGTNPVPAALASSATDSNLPSNVALLLPKAPLALGATYTAHFQGADNTVSVSKTWSFTTPQPVLQVVTSSPYVVHNSSSLVIEAVTPSGVLSVQATPSSFSNHYTIAGQRVIVTIPANFGSQVVAFQLSDGNYPAVPTTPVTVTVIP